MLFFFFKQKTAYEMRISDWSSDVCSSDLRGVFEPQMVDIGADAKFGGQVEIGARADEHRARIVEVRLPLLLRRAQRIQYAVAAVDRDRAPAARGGDRLTDPVAGVGAADARVFEDRLDTALGVVIRVAVAGSIKPRQAETHPVIIITERSEEHKS